MYIDTASDLQKKFLHTYTLYKGELVYWQTFVDQPPTPEYPNCTVLGQRMVNDDKNTCIQELFDPKQLKLIHLDAGWYNVDLAAGNICAAMLVMKKGTRQNYKGISGSNYHFKPAVRMLQWYNSRYMDMSRHEGHTYENIRAMMTPKYFKLDEALDNLVTTRAVALSRDFAVMVSPLKEYNALILSKYGIVAGIMGHIFHVRHEGNFQELLDFVSRSSLDYRVVYEPFHAVKEDNATKSVGDDGWF